MQRSGRLSTSLRGILRLSNLPPITSDRRIKGCSRQRGPSFFASRAPRYFSTKLDDFVSTRRRHINLESSGLLSSVNQTLKGIGQVLFAESSVSGLMVLGTLGFVDPAMAALTFIGAASSTAAAHQMQQNKDSINSGLFGFNGALVGAGVSVFLPSIAGTSLPFIGALAGGALSSVLYVALGRCIKSTPQFTFSFNAIVLPVLAVTRSLSNATNTVALPETVEGAARVADVSYVDWALSPLSGVSQILIVDSPLCGVAVLGAIAAGHGGFSLKALKTGGIAAGSALVGSAIGACVACLLGQSPDTIVSGLHGYNPALAALAVATFYKHNWAVAGLAVGSAAATAVASVGISSALASSLGIPACSLPFCIVASICMRASPFVPMWKLK